MIAAATSALVLQCFFDAAVDGSTATGTVPVVNLTVPAEMTESLSAKQPPLSRNSFEGEAEPRREWVFGDSTDAAAANFQMLRVSLTDKLVAPSPYAARFGTVSRLANGGHRFENRMSGYCKLLPADGVQQ